MSEKLNLGQIITTEQHKDAIHVAVAPVVAGENLSPCAHVCLAEDGRVVVGSKKNRIGIVDPFLCEWVEEGERFWLFLYPGSITSLRHEWTHPAFKDEPLPPEELDTSDSKKWLEGFAKKTGRDYNGLIAMAPNLTGGSAFVGEGATRDRFNDHKEEFLKHLSAVTGMNFDKDNVYFSCAC